MTVRREIRAAVGTLFVFQLAGVFTGIALLARMSPAIERILAENEYSIRAAEEMLTVVATESFDEAGRTQFDGALERAKNNVTEEEERPHLEAIERDAKTMFDRPNDRAVRGRVVEAIVALSGINRRSMREQDTEAQRLGLAGAWSAAAVGLIAFVVFVFFSRRLDSLVVEPLDEIRDAVTAATNGDVYRRCVPRGTYEPQQISRGLNALLDDRAREEIDP
ncbi:MAG: hypothetical protein RIT81_05785 [Deltaproteobacteria bacterium]